MELARATFLIFPIYIFAIYEINLHQEGTLREDRLKGTSFFFVQNLSRLFGQKGIFQLKFSSEMEHSFQLCGRGEDKSVLAGWHRWLLRRGALVFQHVGSLSV